MQEEKNILNGKINELAEQIKNIDANGKKYKDSYNNNLQSVKSTANTLITNIKKDLSKLDEKTRKTFELVYENIEKNIKDSNDQLNAKIDELQNNMNTQKQDDLAIDKIISKNINDLKNEIISENKKHEEELYSKLNNNEEKYEKEIKDIESSLGEAKNNFDTSIQNIEQEILKLKETTNTLKLEEDNNSEVEDLKKNYNQYVKKVDITLEKLTKSVALMQEKNTEGNKNLQIRIKKYIDSKNLNTINQMNEMISKLSLSFGEREKLQNAEMEQMINKKIKEIQKENERLLKKRMEEMSQEVRINNSYSNNIETIDNYKAPVKKKKNLYEPIDSDQMLKQSASNNKTLGGTKEGKSQILKFFYDDDDIN